MPIYESRGNRYNLPEDKVDEFLSKRSDARLVDDTPYYLRRPEAPDSAYRMMETLNARNVGVQDAAAAAVQTYTQVPAYAPDPYARKGKTFDQAATDIRSNIPVRPEAIFDLSVDRYKRDREWISEIQKDSSLPAEVKQALLDDYRVNIRPGYQSADEIEQGHFPPAAREWLERNKVSVEKEAPIPGSGGSYSAKRLENTPEQEELIKDYMANSAEGRRYARAHEDFVNGLEKQIDPLLAQIKEVRRAKAEDIRKNGKPVTANTYRATDRSADDVLLNKAENLLKHAKLRLSANREGGGFRKGFHLTNEDLAELIVPTEQFLSDRELNRVIDKYEKDPESLTEREKIVLQAKYVSDQLTAAIDPGSLYNVGEGTRGSLPFMRDFILTAPAGAGASGLVKAGSRGLTTAAAKGLAGRKGLEFLAGKAGKALRTAGGVLSDLTVRPAVQTALSPSGHAMAYQEMQGQAIDRDDEGNIRFGNRETLGHGFTSALVENASEVSGEVIMGKLFEKMGVPLPALFKTNFAKKLSRHTGIQNLPVEALEEKLVDAADVIRGKQTAADFFDPRKNLEMLGTVGAIQVPFAGIHATGYGIGKVREAQSVRAIRQVYDRATNNLNSTFGKDAQIIASSFGQMIEGLGAGVTGESVMWELEAVVRDERLNDKEKEAIVDYMVAQAAYSGVNRARGEQVQQAQQQAAQAVQENVNPEMDAIVTAQVSGYKTPVQVMNGLIVRKEDGSIDREASSQWVVVVDEEGKRVPVSIKFVTALSENIPAQQAAQQAGKLAQEITVAVQQNEEAPEFNDGDRAIADIDGQRLAGTVERRGEGYVFTDAGGFIYEVEPRQLSEIPQGDGYIGQVVRHADREGNPYTASIVGKTGDNYIINVTDENGMTLSEEITEAQVQELGFDKLSENERAGAYTSRDGQSNVSENGAEQEEQGTTERVVMSSPNEITDEDFTNPTRDIELPPLPTNTLQIIGSRSKPVLIKKNVLEKNGENHLELSPEDNRVILTNALYDPNLVGQSQPQRRNHYWLTIKTGDKNSTAVIDVYPKKDVIEVVGWRYINEKGLGKLERQAEREGGQILILSPDIGSAAALSALPSGSSVAKDSAESAEKQETNVKSENGNENGNGSEAGNNISFIEQIPTDERGNLLFDRVPVETTIGALEEVYHDISELSGVVEATISNIQKQIDKAVRPKPTGDINRDIANKRASNRLLEELNQRLSYWKGVGAAIGQNRPTGQLTGKGNPAIPLKNKRKSKAVHRITPFQRRLRAVEEHIHSAGDRILFGIASGAYKFRWNDEGVSAGTGRELGFSGSEAERKARIGILSNNGYTPASLAHQLWEETGMELNGNDIRGEIIEVLNSVASRTQALEALENRYAGITEEEYQRELSEASYDVIEQTENVDDLILKSENQMYAEFLLSLKNKAAELGIPIEQLDEAFISSDFTNLTEQLEYGKESDTRRDREQAETDIHKGSSPGATERSPERRDRSAETGETESQDSVRRGSGNPSPEERSAPGAIERSLERRDRSAETGETEKQDSDNNGNETRPAATRDTKRPESENIRENESSGRPSPSPEEQRVLDKAAAKIDAEIAEVEKELSSHQKALSAAKKRLDKAQVETQGRFFGENRPTALFDVAADLSRKNVQDAILKPIQDKITFLSGVLADLQDQREKRIYEALENYSRQGNISDAIAEAETRTDTHPTEGQKKAGNYKKGKVSIQGFDLSIEQPKGSTRSGVDENGKSWSVTMKNTYGYIRGTEGKDGDHIDVFLGNNPGSDRVFVVDQVNPQTGAFDEHKVMLGFESAEEAKAAYLSNYEEGWRGLGNLTEVDVETFRRWTESDTRRIKPFAEYKEIREAEGDVRMQLFEKLEEVNARFNSELQQQIDGTLPAGHVYQLGMPGAILQSAGIPVSPIELKAKKLREKSGNPEHPYDISEIKDLPKAINNPLAVFSYGDKTKAVNLITEIERNGKKFLVGISMNPVVRGERLEINDIRNVFPKDTHEWVNWINQGKGLYYNKEKVLKFLDQQQINPAEVAFGLPENQAQQENSKLSESAKDSATKIIEEFENPKLPEEKMHSSDKKTRPITAGQFTALINRLKQTGLARDVIVDRVRMREYLDRRFGNGSAKKFMKVWHGSPHSFRNFSTNFIRSGEGIQAFGWGLYFTEKKYIAEWYAQRLKLKKYKENAIINNLAKQALESANGDVEDALKNQRELLDESWSDKKRVNGVIKVLKTGKPLNEGKTNLYEVNMDDDLSLMRWDKPLTEDQKRRIALQAEKEGYGDLAYRNDHGDWVLNGGTTTGEWYYKEELSRVLGSARAASEFLLRAGIDGIQYPAESIARRTGNGNPEDGFNYVVFDESLVNIAKRIRFMYTSQGEVYGFVTDDGRVYLDPDRMNAHTPIHEFGHLWNSMIDENNPELLERGIELIKQSVYWERVNNNPAYSGLSEDDRADEALAMAIGDKGEAVWLEQQDISLYAQVKGWLYEVWNAIKGLFGMNLNNNVHVEEMTLADFTDRAAGDLLGGKELPFSRGHENDTARAQSDIQYADPSHYDFDVSGITEANAQEMAAIKAEAQEGGTFMKAPNGQPTRLNERQWLQVRTKTFKEWFGDWEKQARIEKLRRSKPIEITGEEITPSEDLKQYKANALEYGKSLRGEYTNKDTRDEVTVSAQGIKEVLRHDGGDIAHIQSIAAIPKIIEGGVFIESVANEDTEKHPKIKEYRYYVSGLKIGGIDYTVKSAIAVDNNGNRYYDHALTQIEKGKLLEELDRITSPSSQQENPLSEVKDKRLLSILQLNPDEISKIVDANGEPLVVYHGTGGNLFNEFKTSENIGSRGEPDQLDGIYFTDKREVAEWYNPYEREEYIKEVFLSIKKPYVSERINTLKEEQGYEKLKGLSKKIEKQGYDGILLNSGFITLGEQKLYLAFNPSQIKSATQNNGNFDERDGDIRFRRKAFGSNSGYVDYSMSKRAAQAREDGKYPKSDFKKAYDITEPSLKLLVEADIIDNNEWHHTSSYGNRTIFYSWGYDTVENEDGTWEDRSYYSVYKANKKEIDRISKELEAARKAAEAADYNPESEAHTVYETRKKEASERLNALFEQTDTGDIRFHIPEPPVVTKNDTWAEIVAKHRAYVEQAKTLEKAYTENMSEVSRFHERAIDKTGQLKNFQHDIVAAGGTLTDQTDAYKDFSRSIGRVSDKMNRFNREVMKPLVEVLTGVASGGKLDSITIRWSTKDNDKPLSRYDKISVYLQAKDILEADALELVERGAKGFSADLAHADGKPWEPKEYADLFEQLAGAEAVKSIWEQVRRVNTFSLDLQLKYGLIDKDRYDSLQTREYYVPQRGWRERDIDGKTEHYVDKGEKFNNNPYNAALVKARGRDSLAGDPLAYMKSIGESTILTVEKNRTKQMALGFVQKNQQLGLRTGTFSIRRVYYVKTQEKNKEGEIMYRAQYTPPGAEVMKRDKAIRDKLDALRKRYRSATGEQEKVSILREMEALREGIQVLATVNESHVLQLTKDEKKQHLVKVIDEGAEYEIEYTDVRVANVLNRNFDAEYGKLSSAIHKGTRAMAALMTQYNPEFAVLNFMRDLNASLIYTQIEYGTAYNLEYVSNIGICQRAVWEYVAANQLADSYRFRPSRTGRLLDEFFQDGAATGYTYLRDVDQLRLDIQKMIDPTARQKIGKAAAAPIVAIGHTFACLTEASELMFRFAAYKTARDRGVSREEAATRAKNLTVNFNVSGSGGGWYSFIFSFYAFVNPSIQGAMKYLRGFNDPKMRPGMIVAAAAYLAGGLMNTLLQPDDPDEERVWGEYDRMQSLILGPVKLAITQQFRGFWGVGAQIGLAMQGRKTVRAACTDALVYFLNENIPQTFASVWNGIEVDRDSDALRFNHLAYIQAIAPTTLSPLADVAMNMDFTGAPVYRKPYLSTQEGTIPQTMLGKRNVSPVAQWFTNRLFELGGGRPGVKSVLKADGTPVNGMLDVNPSALEHIVAGYAPGTGKVVMDLVGSIAAMMSGGKPSISDIIIARRIVKPYRQDKAFFTSYYDLKGKTDMYRSMLDAYRKAAGDPDAQVRENARGALERIQREGTDENGMFKLYVEASKLVKRAGQGEGDRKTIKELDELIVKWNKK